MDPHIVGGYRELGKALVRLKRSEEAEAALQTAAQSDDHDPWTFGHLGIVLRSNGKLKEAHEAFLRAKVLGPDTPVYGPCWAEVTIQLGYEEEGERLLLGALAPDAGDADANRAYGELMAQRGLMDKAVFYLERSVHRAPEKGRARRLLAEIRASRGATEEGGG